MVAAKSKKDSTSATEKKSGAVSSGRVTKKTLKTEKKPDRQFEAAVFNVPTQEFQAIKLRRFFTNMGFNVTQACTLKATKKAFVCFETADDLERALNSDFKMSGSKLTLEATNAS